MSKHVEKCRKIVDELIDRSFPKLKGKNISVGELSFSKNYTGLALKLPFFRVIILHKRAINYSEKLLTGILAHELCHLETWEKFPLRYYFLNVLEGIFKKFRRKVERETDMCSIRKGYGEELYAYRKFRWDEISKNHPIKEIY